jgi:hypothetical protein
VPAWASGPRILLMTLIFCALERILGGLIFELGGCNKYPGGKLRNVEKEKKHYTHFLGPFLLTFFGGKEGGLAGDFVVVF